MSSASTNGSVTVETGNVIRPPRTASSRKSSLKFWSNQAQRTIVASRPESSTTCSAAWASGSPRPESRTIRRPPAAAASAAKAVIVASAPGTTRSGWKLT